MMGIEEAVQEALTEAKVATDALLLVAVSGGPDSTALLRALVSLRESARARVVVCHVDHGIRSRQENEADTAFVRTLCEKLGIDMLVKSVPPGACASQAVAARKSLEETARDARYGLLREAARDVGAAAVLLGHTEDDTIETLLMRVLQGSDVAGLKGIPLRRGLFVRPLLRCTRDQVLVYLDSLGQDWREDPSNRDTVFLRNRVRHILLPLLRKDFPGFRTGILGLSQKLSLAADMIEDSASRLPWSPIENGFWISRDAFLAAPPAVRARSLLSLYDRFRLTGSPRRLPWRFIAPVLTLDALPSRARILIGHGAVLLSRGDALFWGAHIASRGKKGYFIEVSDAGPTVIPGAGVLLSFVRGRNIDGAATGGISIIAREVEPPLVLRSKRKGDRILLESGETPVKDLLAGWKIPETEKNGIPLLADRRGVLAVLGGALGYGTRARAGAIAENREDADRMVVLLLRPQAAIGLAEQRDQGRGK